MIKNRDERNDNKNPSSADLEFIEKGLLVISDREYQLRVWHRADGPELDWYEECMLSFDTSIDYFESLLREGKTSLDPSQVKEILRVFVMGRHFDDILRYEAVPEGWAEEQLYIIDHPYWRKIQKQAAYALSLLKSMTAKSTN